MSTVYIQNEPVDHIRLVNDTGALLEQYEFTVLGQAVGGRLCGVADREIAIATRGPFHVEDGIILQADSFVAGEGVFGTDNMEVFWDPTSGDFSDTETAGYWSVGQLVTDLDGNGVITFTKYRYATLVVS